MACRLAVIERFAALTVAEGKVAFWKRKSPIDLDQAGFWLDHRRDDCFREVAI